MKSRLVKSRLSGWGQVVGSVPGRWHLIKCCVTDIKWTIRHPIVRYGAVCTGMQRDSDVVFTFTSLYITSVIPWQPNLDLEMILLQSGVFLRLDYILAWKMKKKKTKPKNNDCGLKWCHRSWSVRTCCVVITQVNWCTSTCSQDDGQRRWIHINNSIY